MPRSSERGAVRRRYLLPGLRARLLRPLASAISGCAGPATARRVTAPNPGRDPAGGHPPPAAADPLPWPVTGLPPQLDRFPRCPAPAARPATPAGPIPAVPGAGRPACHLSWAVSRGARGRPPGLPPQLGRIPRTPAPLPGLPPQLGRIPRTPAPLPGLPHRRIPAPSRGPGRGPPVRPDPGPVPAPGPLPAALPERGLRIAAPAARSLAA